MVSETCGCGAAFQAERADEIKLLNQWRASHKCHEKADLFVVDSSRNETAPDFTKRELHIGFRADEDEDDD